MNSIKEVAIVGGCGHVGLPLGITLADTGEFQVTLIDVDPGKVEMVNSGHMPYQEAGAEERLKQVVGSRLRATLETSALERADAAVSVIGTPLDEHLNPMVNRLLAAIEDSIARMHAGALLVLRSTVYPGVTKLVYDRIQAQGRSILVAFCPERIAEGRAMEELAKLPQIISAFESEAMARARELFAPVTPELIELEPLEAELAKLFTNSWRYLNFAISNQFYMIAESYGADFARVHEAVTRNYPRMQAFARAGFAAGPCLLKDTLQLSAFASNHFFMGHAAMLVNEGLPEFIAKQVAERRLPGRRVAILGMAFKGDSDDPRDSLAYKLRKQLEIRAFEVLCTDPYISDPRFVPLEEALDRADAITVGAPHSLYKNLRIPPEKVVVDVWRVLPERAGERGKQTGGTAGRPG